MQISSIIPILLNIIQSEQKKPGHSVQSGQPAVKAAAKNFMPLSSSATEKETGATASRPSGSNEQSVLLPLPLKTSLYPDARFFVFRKPEDEHRQQDNSAQEIGIAFGFATATLGHLFFLLNSRPDTLNIVCHTESEHFAARLSEHSNLLKERLREIGFANVIFRCTILEPNLTPLGPGHSSPALLDRKV